MITVEASGPDDIHPEFLYMQEMLQPSGCVSICLNMSYEKMKIPKIWRKATAIALPKPNKPKNYPIPSEAHLTVAHCAFH